MYRDNSHKNMVSFPCCSHLHGFQKWCVVQLLTSHKECKYDVPPKFSKQILNFLDDPFYCFGRCVFEFQQIILSSTALNCFTLRDRWNIITLLLLLMRVLFWVLTTKFHWVLVLMRLIWMWFICLNKASLASCSLLRRRIIHYFLPFLIFRFLPYCCVFI